MSTFLHPTMKFWQAGLEKDDAVIIFSTQFRYKELARWEVFSRHLWRQSSFINSWDSTSDAACPNNLCDTQEDAFEWHECDDYKAGHNGVVMYRIQGVTKDSGGSPLGGVTVDLFRSSDDLKVDTVISDPNGGYTLYTPYAATNHYCVAFKNPNLAGSTVQTLTGS